MDFCYSEEQREVTALARKILGDRCSNEQLRAVEAGGERFDESLWRDLARAGLLGVALEEAVGGMGFGFESLCLLAEEVGRTVAPAPVVPVLVSAAATLQRYGSEALRGRWLDGVASGELLLSAALIEPGCEDPERPRTEARRDGERWRLSGVKHCVPFAHRAAATLLTADSGEGPGLFLVEADADGLELEAQRVTSGEPQSLLRLDGTPATPVALGEDASAAIRWTGQATAAALCAMAVGLCDQMLRLTAAYTSERKQFGVPIATFQAVSHRAADCFIDVECLRLVTQQAVSLLDRELDATEAVTIARIWAGDVSHRVSQAAQHLHGGMGVDRDYPLHRYCLWAKQIELGCGGSAALLELLGRDIARTVIG